MKVPLDIQLVNQDDMKSCSLACIAMLTGRSLLEIRVTAKELGFSVPMSLLEFAKLLTFYDLYALPKVSMGESVFAWGGVYAVSVMSLNRNDQGVCHHVIADLRGRSEVVYDPQKGREGLKYYDDFSKLMYLETMEIINV